MSHEGPRNNFGHKHDIHGYHSVLCQRQSFLDILNIHSNNLSLLLIITVLMLVLSKVKSDKKLIATSQRKKTCKKIPTAKLLLSVRLPLIDSIYNLFKFRKDGIQLLERASEQYGSLFKVHFATFEFTIVSNPVIIQKILSSTQLAHLNRPKNYHLIFGDIFQNGLLLSENEIWAAQRKMLGRSFTYKSLQKFVVFMNTHAANLTRRLNRKCEDNNGIEVQRINQLLCSHAFKIIAQIVMGTDSISPDECNEIANKFNCWKDLASERALNPWKYLWLLPKREEYNRCLKFINDFFVKMTLKYKMEYEQMKLTSPVNKSTHLCTEGDMDDESVGVKPFRCMIEEMICSGASDKEIYEQVGTILVTGHDTTTVAIRMLMLHLALNPDHQDSCRKEVDKVMNDKSCKLNTCNYSDEIDSFNLTMEDLNDLKYLERCISESGRITSIVPVFMRRLDAPLKIDDDLEFPSGTNFVIANWIMHRNPQIYPDPLKFDPDRFLSENVKKRHPYSYTAFSLGPRNCIGLKVAIMQIKVIMAYIIRHFEIFSDDKLENVKLHYGFTIVPEREYRIVLKRREQ